jgi:hypothetical protein
LQEKELVRTLLRTRFGRGKGPVIRQKKERKKEKKEKEERKNASMNE